MSKNWSTTTLSEVVNVSRKSVSPAAMEGDIVELYSIPGFDSGKFPQVVNPASIGSSKTRVPSDAVLVSLLNPRIPRVGIARGGSFCSTEFAVVHPTSELSLEYLFQILQSPSFSNFLAKYSKGTTGSRKRSKREDILRFPAQIPPLHEQKRIVDVMGSVDAAISASQAEVDAAIALEARINLDVFRPLLAGATVQVSMRTDMKLGRQKGGAAATDAPKYATMKSGSITSTHLVNPASFDEMPIPEAWIASHGLRPGDVVLAEGGTVGESAVWPDHLVGDYGYDKHVIRIRPLEGKSTTNFIAHWCRFMKASGTFDATATGKTISALGFGRAAKLPFPDLSVTEQEDVVRPLVAADSAVSTSQSALDRLRDLRSSMLSVLLSGEHEIPETYDQFLGRPERAQAG